MIRREEGCLWGVKRMDECDRGHCARSVERRWRGLVSCHKLQQDARSEGHATDTHSWSMRMHSRSVCRKAACTLWWNDHGMASFSLRLFSLAASASCDWEDPSFLDSVVAADDALLPGLSSTRSGCNIPPRYLRKYPPRSRYSSTTSLTASRLRPSMLEWSFSLRWLDTLPPLWPSNTET